MPGVWFSAQGIDGYVRASTCLSATTLETQIFVFSGECGNLTCIPNAFYDNYCETGYGSQSIAWLAQKDETYLLYVRGSYMIGSFGIAISRFTMPENDSCTGALPIEANDIPIIGSTIDATSSNANSIACDYDSENSDLWYRIIGTGETLTASVSSTTYFDVLLSVLTNTCDELECLPSNFDEDMGDNIPNEGTDDGTQSDDAVAKSVYQMPKSVTWESVEEKAYYIRVRGYGKGPFELLVSIN